MRNTSTITVICKNDTETGKDWYALLKNFGQQEAPNRGIRAADWSIHLLKRTWPLTTVDKLVTLLNHEGQKQTHRITRQISTKTGLIQHSTAQIIRRDFGQKCLLSSNTPAA